MNKSTRIALLGLSLLFILYSWNLIADNATTPKPAVEYHRYDTPTDPEGEMYHQFLPPVPKGSYYDTRQKASANIDDTPEKETVVAILEDGGRGSAFDGNWTQAYLLITTTKVGVPKKKELFKVFDVADHAKSIRLHPPPFIFDLQVVDKPHGVAFKLIDLTGDGILDIWIELGNMVVVISFQNGEFKEIFRSYTYTHRDNPAYVDMDNDGSYELKIPNRVYLDGFFRSSHPVWMNLYEWDGTAYVLNNEKFYVQDLDISLRLLSAYTHQLRVQYKYQRALETEDPVLIQRARPPYPLSIAPKYFEVYDFFIGLVHSYRGEVPQALNCLLSVITEAKNENYRKAALSVLRGMWNKSADPRSFEIHHYRSRLVQRYGNIPEVDIFIAGEKKIISGGFRFPDDEDEFLRYYEAKYVLWPNESLLRKLGKIRKAKADGTPFHLINWNDE